MRLRPIAAGLVACLLALTLAARPAGASTKYPVPYDFLASAVASGLRGQTDAPGSNIWTCTPSAAHPEPVVLVHGTGGNQADNWQTFAPLLANNGYCVFALTYGLTAGAEASPFQVGGLTRMEGSAAELATFVEKVLAATGASKVDILGHSQGTLMPDYYARFLGGADKIDKYVSLAPLWHGTNAGGLATFMQLPEALGFPPPDPAVFGAVAEFAPGSAFLARMRAGAGVVVPGISYTNISTRYDELVVPYTSGIEPGMRNLTVQSYCPLDLSDHLELAADPVAAALVLNALDPAHPRPVPCRLVLPAIGG